MNILPSPSFRKVGSPRNKGGWEEFKKVISSSFRDTENQIKLNSVYGRASLRGTSLMRKGGEMQGNIGAALL